MNPQLLPSPMYDDSFFLNHFSGAPSYPTSAPCCFPGTGYYLTRKPSLEEEVQELAALFHGETDCEEKKRKGVMDSRLEVTPPPSNSTNGLRREKRGRREDEKHKDVVHVRVRRGQATDSHSLAERLRRGKINERLKLLKDIVPGCCKGTGMVVMLDETISYVQSLRNQIQFLSMQLAAASTPQCLPTCFGFELPPSE